MKFKNFSKELKENKYTLIAIIVFIVLLVVAYALLNFFFPNLGSPVYGNRLEGIEEVKISDSEYKKVVDKIKENDIVSEVTYNLSGKIVNFIVTVKGGTKPEDAKKLADLVVPEFSEKQVAYYDFQMFIKNADEEDLYPIIAYKGKNSDKFSYSQSITNKSEGDE